MDQHGTVDYRYVVHMDLVQLASVVILFHATLFLIVDGMLSMARRAVRSR